MTLPFLPFQAKPGDIMGLRGSGWISDQICELTRPSSPIIWEGVAIEWSHVGIVTAVAPFVQVTEALTKVRTRPIDVSIAEAEFAWIAQLGALTDQQRAMLARKALSFSADDYGYADIGLQALDSVTRSRWFTQHFAERRFPICSMLDALDYDSIGIRLGISASSATPNDLARYVTTHAGWAVQAVK